jgi:prepilin-type processing-associated H-X9-DG protein
LKLAWDHPRNASVFKSRVLSYENPGLPDDRQRDAPGRSLTEYAANVHVLGGPRRLTFASITDGTSNTILAGEIARRFPPWGMTGNSRDPAKGINRSPAGFGGPYPGGANVSFVDGAVRFIKNTVDPKVLEALGTPKGGEVVGDYEYSGDPIIAASIHPL